MPDSKLMALWQALNKPMVPQIQEGWDAIANQIDPGTEISPTMARIRGGLAGGLQGLGSVAAGLTSPIGLATLAAGSILPRGAGSAARPMVEKPIMPAEFSTEADAIPSVRPRFPDPQEQAYKRILEKQATLSALGK